MTFGPGVRAQVFEVIVRQAIAGAPWREICAGPMRVNNISPEEVEYEVDRRLNMGKEVLTGEQKKALDKYVGKWEILLSAPARKPDTTILEPEIANLYATKSLDAPVLVYCESPAALCFYLFCLDQKTRGMKSPLDVGAELAPVLSKSQHSSFEDGLIERLKFLHPDLIGRGAGECLTADFELDFKDLSRSIVDHFNAHLDSRLVGYFRFGFKVLVNRFLNRAATLFAVTNGTIDQPTFNLVSNSPSGQMLFRLAGEKLVPRGVAVWETPDLLSYGFASEHMNDIVAIPTKLQEELKRWSALYQAAPWYVFFENVCFIGMNPAKSVFDEQLRLSNHNGPSIVYADGYEVFSIEGILMPRKLIEQPESLSISDIAGAENAAVRRLMVDTFGVARYIQESGAELIQKDECGELYRKEMPHDEPILMVRVQNSTPEPDGTYKFYFLRVPPSLQTAREAIAWTFNLPVSDYGPAQET